MGCERYREALSAKLDGEQPPLDPAVLDRHLDGCTGCRAWYDQAQDLRRWLSVRAAPPVPDLTEVILTRIPAPTGEKWPARIALGIVAFAQLTLALAQLLGVATGMDATSDDGSMLGHLSHESTAWNFAVGVGLLWAALRTKTAGAQLPPLTGFLIVLTILSAHDLLNHEVTVGRVLSHGLIVLGVALLYVVHRQHRHDHQPHPVTGDALGTDTNTASNATHDKDVAAPDANPQHPAWRRPASHRRTA